MSSRFVSAGQIDAGTGDTVSKEDPSSSTTTTTTTTTAGASAVSARKQAEWAAVQAQLDAEKIQREEARRAAHADAGPSLFDVLQANKAAKQAAFEEANKIRNQFRALDDDEIEFLDGVRETRRQEEETRRAEMEEGLKAFREAQAKEAAHPGSQDADGGWDEATQDFGGGGGGDEWAVSGRKRKREKEKMIKGIKRRTSSFGKDSEHGAKEKSSPALDRTSKDRDGMATKAEDTSKLPAAKTAAAPKPEPKASLVAYGSDDESD